MTAVTFRYPPTQNAVQKTLASALDTGVTASMTLNNTTNVQNQPGVCVVDRIDTDGNLKSASVREFIAYAGTSGATLTTLTRNVDSSSSDQDHAVGAVVEFIPDVTFAQALIDALTGVKSGVVLQLPQIQDTSSDHQYVFAVNELTADRTVTLPLLTGNDTFAFVAHTQTLTNKRITKRISTETSSATPTINTDNVDMHTLTALADNITSFTTNLSGTPTNGQTLIIRIQDSGSGQTISWGASFESAGATLPTSIAAGKKAYVGLIWNSADSKWDCIASVEEA